MKKDCDRLIFGNSCSVAIALICTCLSLLITACQNNREKEGEQEIDETQEQVVKSDLFGNYVTVDYFQREEGYDWVAVTIREDGENKINVSVRSRADRKKPTCTFDTKAYFLDDSTYYTSVEGKQILFVLSSQALQIKTANAEDNSLLYFYCSGGASLAGKYIKLDEDLDFSQIDKTLFSKTLSLQGIGFNITSIREGGRNLLTIAPYGLELINRPETIEIVGLVIDAEIEDLNSDGSPEILVYTQSEEPARYGDVVGYSVNNRKSMSRIYFPPISENHEINQGYRGQDEFATVETSLARRFPIYKENDADEKPSGGTRQIQYLLKEGEASRLFVVKQVTEY